MRTQGFDCAELRRPGFTLIELMVVIAIISMLAGMLLPALSSARERGRRADCLNNIRQVAISMKTYGLSYKDFVPPNTYTNHSYSNFMSVGGSWVDLGLLIDTRALSMADFKIFWCMNERRSPIDNWGQRATGTVACSWVKSGSNMDPNNDPNTTLNVSYLWGDRFNKGKALLAESITNHIYGVNVFYFLDLSTEWVNMGNNHPDVFDQPLQFYGKLRKP